MTILNTETQVTTPISITSGRTVTTSYEAEEYGSYVLTVKDDLGFEKQYLFTLQEQVLEIETPTVTLEPNTRTNGSVTATLNFTSDDITITNNGGEFSYTFTTNNTFVFEYQNSAGAADEISVTVDTIVPVNIEKTYESILRESAEYIRKIPVNTTGEEFLNNIDVIDADYKILDMFENNVSKSTALATSMKLITDTDKEYTLIVTGDINADGAVTSTDISQLKLYMVEATQLTGERLYAADMNFNDAVTLTDLSQLKAKVVGM